MRRQQKYDCDEDGDCDSDSANDVDVEDNSDDGGKHERRLLQQQQSSTSIGRYRRRHGQQCRLVYIIFTFLRIAVFMSNRIVIIIASIMPTLG